MLNDPHLCVIQYYPNARDVFPSVDLKGGVAICLRDENQNFGAIKQYIPNETMLNIAKKMVNLDASYLPSIMHGGRSDLKFNNAFLNAYPQSKGDRLKAIQSKTPKVTKLSQGEEYELKSSTFDVLPYIFKQNEPKNKGNFYRILGLENGNRQYRWIEKDYMAPRYPEDNNIAAYKVFVSESNGSGKFGEALSSPVIGLQDDSSTPTFISIGNFATLGEALNAQKYLKTKFVRALLGLRKKTQHNPPAAWAYIPCQNFEENSDIDWSASIAGIDEQLFLKYGLTEEEIAFIWNNVKAME